MKFLASERAVALNDEKLGRFSEGAILARLSAARTHAKGLLSQDPEELQSEDCYWNVKTVISLELGKEQKTGEQDQVIMVISKDNKSDEDSDFVYIDDRSYRKRRMSSVKGATPSDFEVLYYKI